MRGSLTNEFRIDVSWELLTTYVQRGGSTIDSYELQIDDGLGGAFTEVVGYTTFFTDNQVVVNTDIQSGFAYRLKYRAHNVHGWGDSSPVVTILAATTPGQTGEPATTIEDSSIKISWTAPESTGGANVAISNYLVQVQLLDDGEFIDACSVTELHCLLNMQDLLVDPYNFSQGNEIVARVTASNSLGEGPISALSA